MAAYHARIQERDAAEALSRSPSKSEKSKKKPKPEVDIEPVDTTDVLDTALVRVTVTHPDGRADETVFHIGEDPAAKVDDLAARNELPAKASGQVLEAVRDELASNPRVAAYQAAMGEKDRRSQLHSRRRHPRCNQACSRALNRAHSRALSPVLSPARNRP